MSGCAGLCYPGRLIDDDGTPSVRAELVGRESELELLSAFVGADASATDALVLTGAPGIGKTRLWEAAVEQARSHGRVVLATRASEAEARLSFGALAGLLDGVDLGALPGVPGPQRRALDVALLRREPEPEPPSPHAIALGLLAALRALASQRPVVLAVDDVQWLDTPSADALAFVARRLGHEPVRVLLARRPSRETTLEAAFGERLARLEVGPLELGAARRLLFGRFELTLPRHVLRRLVDLTRGNPLFTIEVGRALLEQADPRTADLPVPDTIEDLLDTRVADLSQGARRVLLSLSLSAEPTPSQLVRVAGQDAVDEAVEAGLAVVEGGRVRPAHPLYAAAARKRSRPAERRALHLVLARIVDDEQLRARHLALATTAPDEELAATIAAAAVRADARGARRDALELAEHALRLTPDAAASRPERLLLLAASLETAGELRRLTDLLGPAIDSIPPGHRRARAWLLLSEGAHVRDLRDYRDHLEHALAEARDDPALRARVVAKVSSAVIGVERIADAEARALEALPAARAAGPDVERPVLFALAWARGLRGLPVDDICRRWASAADWPGFLAESPDRVAGQRLVWRGRLDEARALFERLDALAEERGELATHALARLHLCEVALRAGDCAEAARVLEEWAESSEGDLLVQPGYQRCRALLATIEGRPEEAERWATDAIAAAAAVGTQWDWLEGLRALGTSALLSHRPEQAVAALRQAWDHLAAEGVDEPGVFPVAPELVEALAEIGAFDDADAVRTRLRRLATELDHPWGLATADRCDAIARLAAGGDYDEGATLLRHAADAYAALGLGFDQARSLLALGRSQRRRRKRKDARRTLEEAASVFERSGSTGWAEAARSELERVGARHARPAGALTPAEERVAQLAAAGLANKEIARTLFITVNTVEEHLSRAYEKLGIRSRTQLAARLPS